MDGEEKQMNAGMKAIKKVMQSIYGISKAYCPSQRREAVQKMNSCNGWRVVHDKEHM